VLKGGGNHETARSCWRDGAVEGSGWEAQALTGGFSLDAYYYCHGPVGLLSGMGCRLGTRFGVGG
jgi:hypothetical protein